MSKIFLYWEEKLRLYTWLLSQVFLGKSKRRRRTGERENNIIETEIKQDQLMNRNAIVSYQGMICHKYS